MSRSNLMEEMATGGIKIEAMKSDLPTPLAMTEGCPGLLRKPYRSQ
ncbi:MAG: hypothetical protein F6K23_01415 [Okeania sp. SIO2C9]|nr:hypothetical protein [Okeania sp. SIO2C9]